MLLNLVHKLKCETNLLFFIHLVLHITAAVAIILGPFLRICLRPQTSNIHPCLAYCSFSLLGILFLQSSVA